MTSEIILPGEEDGKTVYTATVTFEGKEYTGTTETPIARGEYKFDGDPVTWEKGSKTAVKLHAVRSEYDELTFTLFDSVEVDGQKVAASNYEAAAGSLNLTLKPEYLETLKEGKHTVKALFKDGEAETSITVKAKADDNQKKDDSKNAPRTDDETVILPWALLLSVSMIGLGVVLTKKHKEGYDV